MDGQGSADGRRDGRREATRRGLKHGASTVQRLAGFPGVRVRIARGSGVTIQDVNGLLKQFKQVQTMMKSAGKMGKGKRGRMPKLPPGMDLSEMGLS